jgi:DNA polymerase I-like protein with 3'-5' exonuclease and polymerase domains
MKLTIDIENTVTKKDGKMYLDPYEATNKLVMIGCLDDNGNETIYDMDSGFVDVQDMLNKATVLIGHNVTYDLMWLWECGFKYNGVIFDTMLAEYVLSRGNPEKYSFSLEACADRHELNTRKQDTLKEYFAKGMGVDEIPKQELKEYLRADLKATQELCASQYKKLINSPLMDTVILTNKVAMTLARTHRNGFKVDQDVLESVRKEFEAEKISIEKRLSAQVRDLMGDTPINLNSPEQMSWVIYSRKPKDKSLWANYFSPYMDKNEYKDLVREHSDVVYKTTAVKCSDCNGEGYFRRTKKDGTPFAKPSRCPTCNTQGYLFISNKNVAGLKFSAPTAKWVSANGFTINKNYLDTLRSVAKRNGMTDAVNFLTDLQRLSALDTYLSSFVDGIKAHVKQDGMLHVRLLQHRTATGRFSGADPNMQNMPRGGTFPVKKVFVSRWKGGKILEADFAQLEFRTAAYLSQDKVAINEIKTGFDVHAYTASVISASGQSTTRQEAKAHTFAPLYGATGFGRTEAEAKYYQDFTKKYKGIALWHSRLAKEALEKRSITTPSGRQFSFPDVERRRSGSISHFTQIKNYPVQSFATADIVPLILVHIEDRLQSLNSCIVNTVHDSIVIDVHPDEINKVVHTIKTINQDIINIVNQQFGIDFNVPLLLESKIGNNWLDTKDVA